MKIIFNIILVCLSVSVFGQPSQNEIYAPADSKEALDAVKQNRKIRKRSRVRTGDNPNARLRLANKGLNQSGLSYNYNKVRKERELFKEADNHHIVLIDLEAYFLTKKKQPVKIYAGENIKILSKKKKKYKVQHKHRKLYIDRQFYTAKKE